jgi:hypothetical protein
LTATPDSNAGEPWRTLANAGELLTLTLNYKMNFGEPWRMLADNVPTNFKPLVGILGDVDGRIVPVAPPPVSNLESDRRTKPWLRTGVRRLGQLPL